MLILAAFFASPLWAFNEKLYGTSAVTSPYILVLLNPVSGAVEDRLTSLFVEGNHDTKNVWAKAGWTYFSAHDYSAQTFQGTAGVDRHFGEKVTGGFSLSGVFGRYRSDPNDNNQNWFDASLYGGLVLPLDLEAGFSGRMGVGKYKQTRYYGTTPFDADYNGTDYGAALNLGRQFRPMDGLRLRPFLRYEYRGLNTDSYSESSWSRNGGGSSNSHALHVEGHNENLHEFGGGAAIIWQFMSWIELSAQGSYSALLGDHSSQAQVRLGTAQDTVTTKGYDVGSYLVDIKALARFTLSKTFTVTAHYELGLLQAGQSQSIALNANYAF
jgi:hypothetical protein